MANGAMKVFEQFKSEIAGAGLKVILELRAEATSDEIRLSKSGCQGFCQMGPLAEEMCIRDSRRGRIYWDREPVKERTRPAERECART